MTTAHTSAPAGVAGLEPDVGGVSDELATLKLPVLEPRRTPSSEAGVWKVPATAVAGALTGLALRGWLTVDARFVLVVVLLVLLIAACGAVYVAPRLLGMKEDER